MSLLTMKPLPRRTLLRGLGATLALPLLDAMLPVVSLRGAAAAPARPSLPDVLCPQRHGDGALDAQRRRQRL